MSRQPSGSVIIERKLASALAIFDEGYAPFPCVANTKIPVVKWTVDYATSREQVADWWTNWPDDNIGVNCKESNLLVVDLDGAEGIEEFEELWHRYERGDYRDYTRTVVTPHDGEHLWFNQAADPPLRNTTKLLTPNVDTRGAGGIVLVPGSEIDGRPYRFINDREPVDLPRWLEQKLRALEPASKPGPSAPVKPWSKFQAKMMLAEVPRHIAVVHPGRRNDVLNREAFRMRPALDALGYEAVYDALWAAAEQNGLVGEEHDATQRTIRSGLGC